MGTLTNIFILSLLSFFAFLAVKLGKFSPEFKHAYANAHGEVDHGFFIHGFLEMGVNMVSLQHVVVLCVSDNRI